MIPLGLRHARPRLIPAREISVAKRSRAEVIADIEALARSLEPAMRAAILAYLTLTKDEAPMKAILAALKEGNTVKVLDLIAGIDAGAAKEGVQDAIRTAAWAGAAAAAVRDTLVPELHKIVDTMDGLTGGKALLRERWRAFDAEEARQGRWRFQPWAVVVGIPLALVVVLALLVPRAAAYAAFTCRATGGTWSPATEHFLSGCTYSADKRAAASSS